MILNLITSGYSIDIILILLVADVLSVGVGIVCHETAHAAVALWCGDDTAKRAGRISLNPMRHFDLLGAILMLVVGFGWAKPVPINPYNFKNRKLDIALVSLAGIFTNLLIAGLGLLLIYLFYPLIINLMLSANMLRLLGYFFYYFLIYLVIINVMLAFFNLLPIAPLDGFNFLNSFLPAGNSYSRFMFRYGTYILLIIIVISNLLNLVGLREYNVFYQIQKLALRLIEIVTGG